MIDAAIVQVDLLELLTEAYADGDAPRGDALLHEALDAGHPWDEVCAAAARGMTRRYGERNVA
ncbi:MAG: hypothetical protein IT305_04605 [Chloroflexi bacterium]|nr:hypothetical protein [Chloroflexota bacterium]